MIPTMKRTIGASAFVMVAANGIELFSIDVRKKQPAEAAISDFVSTHGVKRFKIFPTQVPEIYVVEIKQGKPSKAGKVIQLRKLPDAIGHARKSNTLPAGSRGIAAIHEVARKLKPKATKDIAKKPLAKGRKAA